MLRITGGEFRGRSIQAPTHDRTRPTQAKLRQALFNSLQASIPDAKVLDLFAGSGALGFEALSRGAAEVIFVETSKAALKVIQKNAAVLGVEDRVTLIEATLSQNATGHSHLAAIQKQVPFDLVLADPPYSGGWESWLITELPWAQWLSPDGFFCLEWGTQKSKINSLPDQLPFLVKTREKNYGDSMLTTYRRSDLSREDLT